MTRSDMLKSGYCIRTAVFFLLLNFSLARANEGDMKPGDTVGPHNWQRVQGMVGENFLNRIKQGYTFKIRRNQELQTTKGIFRGDGKILRPGEAREQWRAV